jgi:hypothetical protein
MLTNFQVKKRSLHFPIRIPFQYVFICHFAEVYDSNALRFTIKNQSLQFPICMTLSLRRSLFR